MTELLGQPIFFRRGRFRMSVMDAILVRDPEDALTYVKDGKTGGINVLIWPYHLLFVYRHQA